MCIKSRVVPQSLSSSQANHHKMGSFQKGVFLVLCCLYLIHGTAALSVAEPEVSAYFHYLLRPPVAQFLTQDSTTKSKTGPSTLTLTRALPFLSAPRIHATIWLPGVVSRKHRSLPSTRKVCAPLCRAERPYAVGREQVSFHQTVVVTATLILSAMAIPARRLPRGTRSPRPRSKLGTPILRHGTGATSCRLGARFVLARANPQCQLQSAMQYVVPNVPGTARPKLWTEIASLNPCPAGQCVSSIKIVFRSRGLY
jgi:hypothetical protein